MKVSFIVVNFNYADYLETCIDSILKILLPDDELIVIDDRSTDNSWNIVQNYRNQAILLRNEVNSGMLASSVYALQASTNEVVMFVDSDDFLLESFSLFREKMLRHYDKWQGLNQGANYTYSKSKSANRRYYRTGDYIGPPTSGCLYRKSKIMDVLSYCLEEQNKGEDDGYFSRFSTDGILRPYAGMMLPIQSIRVEIFHYRDHELNNGRSISPWRDEKKVMRQVSTLNVISRFNQKIGVRVHPRVRLKLLRVVIHHGLYKRFNEEIRGQIPFLRVILARMRNIMRLG